MGFIKEGSCHVLRKVDVVRKSKKKNESDSKELKQVVVGKLGAGESFGEVSIVQKEPMTCSIVTETQCKIGIIHFEKLYSNI